MPFDPVAGRLHQAHRRVRGNRRVDGVAAPLEDLNTGACGQRLTGGHDAHRGRDD